MVTAVPEGLEKDILGCATSSSTWDRVNPNAPEEYDELNTRHAFLTEQAQDAHHAIERLTQGERGAWTRSCGKS